MKNNNTVARMKAAYKPGIKTKIGLTRYIRKPYEIKTNITPGVFTKADLKKLVDAWNNTDTKPRPWEEIDPIGYKRFKDVVFEIYGPSFPITATHPG